MTATVNEILDSIEGPEMLRYDPVLALEAITEYTSKQFGVQYHSLLYSLAYYF